MHGLIGLRPFFETVARCNTRCSLPNSSRADRASACWSWSDCTRCTTGCFSIGTALYDRSWLFVTMQAIRRQLCAMVWSRKSSSCRRDAVGGHNLLCHRLSPFNEKCCILWLSHFRGAVHSARFDAVARAGGLARGGLGRVCLFAFRFDDSTAATGLAVMIKELVFSVKSVSPSCGS